MRFLDKRDAVDPRLQRFATDNALAVLLREVKNPAMGVEYIIYDADWIERTLRRDEWAVKGIVAREIAHHVMRHTLSCQGSNHAVELQADEWAGAALARMGATLEQAQAWWRAEAAEVATRTHPALRTAVEK